jgi:hypothetical protein
MGVLHYLSKSRFRLCLALQPQLPQLSCAFEKPLLRCVVVCSCLWSVSFLCLAGFENPLGALPVCVVMLKHTYETPESQQSSNFLSKSHLSIKGVAENQESKTLAMTKFATTSQPRPSYKE